MVFPYIPRRIIIGLALCVSFFFCNLQRSCVSMSILAFSLDQNWDETDKGMLLSAFGWGYITSQLTSVGFVKKFGSKWTLSGSVCLSVRQPLFATFWYILVGISQGPLWPCYWDIINNWFHKSEKGTIVAFINLGALLGICVSFGTSSFIFEYLNWQSSFYLFGFSTVIWVPLWLCVFENSPFLNTSKRTFPLFSMNDAEKDYIKLNDGEDLEEKSKRNHEETPWRKLISNRIVMSVVIAQFCINWTFYITVAWIPSYFKNELQFNLKDAGYMSVLPFFLLSIISQSSGFVSDYLIKHEILSRSFTRKVFQSIGFISLSTMFCIITFFTSLSPLSIVTVFTIGVGFMGTSAGGINACYSDISIEYSGAIHALSNTFASFPAAAGIFIIGFILDKTGNNWTVIWFMSIFISILGLVTFTFGVSFETIQF